MAFVHLVSILIIIQIVSIRCQDVFANLQIQESLASCFGLENDHTRWMRATCSSQDLVILIESFTVVFHPVVMNCTNNTVIYEEYRDACCLKGSVNNTRDCTVTHQFDTKYSVANYQTCNGHSSCNVMVPQLLVRNTHCPYDIFEPIPHDIVSNFMYMNYYCLEKSLILPDSTGSLTTPSPGSVIYLQSPGFSSRNQRIPYMTDSECSIQTDNCSPGIYVYILHLVLEDSNTGEYDTIPCNQTLKIETSRGDVLEEWTCDENTNLQKGPLTLNANYILLKLDNNYTSPNDWDQSRGGAYWLGFKSLVTTGNIRIDCPAIEPPICTETTTTVTTSLAEMSFTIPTTSTREASPTTGTNTTVSDTPSTISKKTTRETSPMATDHNTTTPNTNSDSTTTTPIVADTAPQQAIPTAAVIALPSGLSVLIIIIVVIVARFLRLRRTQNKNPGLVQPCESDERPYEQILSISINSYTVARFATDGRHDASSDASDDQNNQYLRPLPIPKDQKENVYDNNRGDIGIKHT
ncbi:uncharacterized protein LOC128231658 [Mya arenaria]|uniref:uncharacterized protein LOC128231658 n=1 Tax=Mya arenaria TaxID=6604 RepID=UPI0022E8F835|nr:uncharacterized protein LOC128231658 [Mya arenaria]